MHCWEVPGYSPNVLNKYVLWMARHTQSLKSTFLTAKFGSLDHVETGEKNTKCDQFFCPTSDYFFGFGNPCFFYHTFTNDAYFAEKSLCRNL